MPKTRHIALLAALISPLTSAQTTMASQVHHFALELKAVVRMASHVVIARRATPATHTVKLPIPKAPDKEPFVRVDDRWIIEEIIHGEPGQLKIGQTIAVAPGSWGDLFGTHILYYRDGEMESPALMSHTPSEPVKPGEPAILMLGQSTYEGEAVWAYVVSNAIEPVSARATVERALRAPDTLKPTPAEETP